MFIRKKELYKAICCLFCFILFFCSDKNSLNSEDKVNEDDSIYTNSKYVLPYPVGTSYMCWQGRSYGGHNRGNLHNAQDFAMPLNTIITAARNGIIFLKEKMSKKIPEVIQLLTK